MKVKIIEKMVETFFLIGVFISPFIFWPKSPVAFEVPKVWFICRWIEILGLISIFAIPTIKKERVDSFLILLICTFFIETLISALLGVNFGKSIVGNYYRGDGLNTYLRLFVLYLFLILYFKKEWINKLFLSFLFSSSFLAILAIANYLFGFINKEFIANWDGAVGINFGNPHFLAGYLLVSLPFTLYFIKKYSHRKRIVFRIFLILQVIAIILTGSWAGILGVIIFLTFIVNKIINNNLKYPFIIFAFVLVGFLFAKNYQRLYQGNILVAESRIRIVRKALISIKQKPLLGWGWANFDYAFESVDWPIKIYDDVYVDKAHSNILEVLVTSGGFGFVLYILILIRVGFNIYKQKSLYSKYLFAVFVIFIIHSQTNIISISEEMFFWILAAISSKIYIFNLSH